nr:RAD52 motif-containing protein 1-like [Lepeophtheirus salmonis]
MDNVEIIDFNLPLGASKSIVINKIPWNKSSEELKFFLERCYQSFGLIHSIILKKRPADNVSKHKSKLSQKLKQVSSNNQSPDKVLTDMSNCKRRAYFVAFINFYSSNSTAEARIKTHGCRIIRNSKPFRVIVKISRGFTEPRGLNYRESVELANYYFGFNGWSYKIIYHRAESMFPHILRNDIRTESRTTHEGNKLLWVSVVRVVVEDLIVEGVAREIIDLDVDISRKGAEFRRAQTQASREALVNALGKLLIVIISHSGCKKIKAVIDTNVKDPFFYDPLWETSNLELTKFSCSESTD